MTHTPGPWPDPTPDIPPQFWRVGMIACRIDDIDTARLIAAAPMMLDALQMVLWSNEHGRSMLPDDVTEQARAAIDAAKP